MGQTEHVADLVGQGLAAVVAVLRVDVGLVLVVDQVPGFTLVRTRAVERQIGKCRATGAAVAVVAEGHVTVAA
ncbi:hypothetical protein D3C84_1079930 [compost metagenome]